MYTACLRSIRFQDSIHECWVYRISESMRPFLCRHKNTSIAVCSVYVKTFRIIALFYFLLFPNLLPKFLWCRPKLAQSDIHYTVSNKIYIFSIKIYTRLASTLFSYIDLLIPTCLYVYYDEYYDNKLSFYSQTLRKIFYKFRLQAKRLAKHTALLSGILALLAKKNSSSSVGFDWLGEV